MKERYEKEIEEILQQTGEPRGKKSSKGGRVSRYRLRILFGAPGLSSGKLLLLGVLLLLTALLLRGRVPGLIGLLFWAGLVLLIAAYALFFLRWQPRSERRWRGQVVECGGQPSWWDRLVRWLRR